MQRLHARCEIALRTKDSADKKAVMIGGSAVAGGYAGPAQDAPPASSAIRTSPSRTWRCSATSTTSSSPTACCIGATAWMMRHVRPCASCGRADGSSIPTTLLDFAPERRPIGAAVLGVLGWSAVSSSRIEPRRRVGTSGRTMPWSPGSSAERPRSRRHSRRRVATRKRQTAAITRFKPRPAKFGVAAMMRNEAPYLLEWIALLPAARLRADHDLRQPEQRCLGPDTPSAARPGGIINAIYWNDRPRKQAEPTNNAVRRLRPFVEWCLFADLDEFLLLDPDLTLDDLLPKEPGHQRPSPFRGACIGSAGHAQSLHRR